MKVWIVLAVIVTAGTFVSSAVAFYVIQNGPGHSSPSCSALGIGWNSVRHDSGLTYLCGTESVSDGRLTMTLDNYRFVDAGMVTSTCVGDGLNGTKAGVTTTCKLGDGVYLLANVTFANIGRGNTSIGVLFANITNGVTSVGNSDSTVQGGTFLPPGNSVTTRFDFYVPNTAVKDIPNLKLNNLSFLERIYGGIWEGGGGFRCPCGYPMTDLIVVLSASTPTTTTTTTYTTALTSSTPSTLTTSGQPLVEVTNTSLPSSIPASGGSNITISCERPTSGTYGTIVVVNQGTGSASLRVLVIQYSALSPMGGYATATLGGQSCGYLPPNSVSTLYVTGLPALAQNGSYYDGWAVLKSGSETNVFSGQFT